VAAALLFRYGVRDSLGLHGSRHHTIEGETPGIVAMAPERHREIAIGGDADDLAAWPEHDQTAAPGLAHPAAGVRQVHGVGTGLGRLGHDVVNLHHFSFAGRWGSFSELCASAVPQGIRHSGPIGVTRAGIRRRPVLQASAAMQPEVRHSEDRCAEDSRLMRIIPRCAPLVSGLFSRPKERRRWLFQ
jgi:hypothetical protein